MGNAAGFKVPWEYVRSKVAERWHCTPWEVDDSPIGELETELTIMHLENETRPVGS